MDVPMTERAAPDRQSLFEAAAGDVFGGTRFVPPHAR